MSMTGPFTPDLVARLSGSVVGRRAEIEQVVAALAARRHLLLEGPPGTGKSTLLRHLATEVGRGFRFVEGNAELTPARLVGTFDPAAVLDSGYAPEVFLDGPLLGALRDGALLYIEEINRIPEETLNVLISVMSEGALTVPRLGTVEAADGFGLIAAMNPFDAVGTARISSAVYDRVCRLAMGYQDPDEEARIVEVQAGSAAARVGATLVAQATQLVRATREHPDVRVGSSVRGAIDLTMLAAELHRLRDVAVDDPSVTRDAARLAVSGRIRAREGCGRTAEDIVDELWAIFFAADAGSDRPGGEDGADRDGPDGGEFDGDGPDGDAEAATADAGGAESAPGRSGRHNGRPGSPRPGSPRPGKG